MGWWEEYRVYPGWYTGDIHTRVVYRDIHTRVVHRGAHTRVVHRVPIPGWYTVLYIPGWYTVLYIPGWYTGGAYPGGTLVVHTRVVYNGEAGLTPEESDRAAHIGDLPGF